ncbi:MAG: hypothetical protein ACLVAW_21535 [Eisenbergiella massiliensis]
MRYHEPGFYAGGKRKELLEGIHDGISDLKETIEVKAVKDSIFR